MADYGLGEKIITKVERIGRIELEVLEKKWQEITIGVIEFRWQRRERSGGLRTGRNNFNKDRIGDKGEAGNAGGGMEINYYSRSCKGTPGGERWTIDGKE